jgi:hypothetical protein
MHQQLQFKKSINNEVLYADFFKIVLETKKSSVVI